MIDTKLQEYLASHFPKWELLELDEKSLITQYAVVKLFKRGELIHRSEEDCKGIMLIHEGQLRVYISSEQGREVTLFRVKAGDLCLLTASCLMDSIAFDVIIDAIEDSTVIMVPTSILKNIMENHMELELYMCKNINDKFSDILWTMQQILFFSADKRVANFLWDEYVSNGNKSICYTQDEIAKLIGSAREVVSKVLKYLAEEGVVSIGRGKVSITDKEKLKDYL